MINSNSSCKIFGHAPKSWAWRKLYTYIVMPQKHTFILTILALSLLLLAKAGTASGNETGKRSEPGQTQKLQRKANLGLTQEELAFLQEHPVIRVGNEEGWAPFDFNKHGKPKGYAIDHLKILGRKLGITFKFVNGYSWAELLDLFKQGKIDLLPSLWISESRKEYMLFTEPFIKLPYILVTKQDNREIQGFSDLKGRTVAVPKSYKQEEILKKDYPQIELYQVKGALEGLKAVNYGKADAFIGYRGTVDYLIATKFLTDLEIKGEVDVPELGPQGLYIGVQKDMQLLRSALQKAMDTVSNQQKVRLARKWITLNKSPAPSLNEKEKKFLSKNQVLRVDNLQGWPPFNFLENGKPKGFCIDYMRLLADKLDVRLKFVSGHSWERYLEMLKKEKIDVLCDVVETKKRRNYIDFTRPYFVIFSGIVVKKGKDHLSDLASLAGKMVAVPEDFYHEEILKREYPAIDVITKKNTLECLKSVSSGETAAALAEKPVFDYLINKHFLLDLKSVPIMENVHFENTPVSIGVKKDRNTLRSILQKTMNVVTEEEINSLKKKWLDSDTPDIGATDMTFSAEEREYLTKTKKVHICVHPSRMPLEGIGTNGEYSGIFADILSLIHERTSIEFKPVPARNRKKCIQKSEAGDCEMVSALHKNPETTDKFLFTKPFLKSSRVIIAPDNTQYIPGMESLLDKKVGIVRGDPVEKYIESNYPEIELTYAQDTEKLLKKVATKEMDVGIAGLQMVSYKIHEIGLYDLKIAGKTPFNKFFRMGVSNENPQLRSILNKAIDSVSSQEINRIVQNWLSIKYEHGFNYRMLWKIVGVAGIIIGGILLWNRKLSKLNRKIAEAHEDLARKNKELEKLSITDKLTGVFNRLRLEEVLEQECDRNHRYEKTLSVILADIDDFKEVNDLHGHQRGDEVLREIAKNLCTNIRKTDTAGRWGGEEFLIICPETSRDGAYTLAQKLQKRIENLELEDAKGVTCSFGVAEIKKNESAESFLSRVDNLMYKAKDAGKNKVICAN